MASQLYDVAYITDAIKPYAGNSGTCNPTLLLSYMNKARRLLWNKTDIDSTCEYVCVACVGGILTLPSLFKQVRLAWIDGVPVSLGNEWYQSIPQDSWGDAASGGYGNGWGQGYAWNGGNKKFIEIGGKHITYQNYERAPYQLCVESESPLDAGTEITFFGENAYGTRISETITLGLAPAYSYSINFFKSVFQVTKPQTQGRVRLYAYDPDAPAQMLLAVYQPYDINPNFRRYSIQGRVKDSVILYCKKNYQDLFNLTDQVEFTPEAMISAVMAVVYRENKGSDELYNVSLQNAIFEVNRETADQEEPTGSVIRQFSNNMMLNALIPTYVWDDGATWPY
jgi:hypothetical protein